MVRVPIVYSIACGTNRPHYAAATFLILESQEIMEVYLSCPLDLFLRQRQWRENLAGIVFAIHVGDDYVAASATILVLYGSSTPKKETQIQVQ